MTQNSSVHRQLSRHAFYFQVKFLTALLMATWQVVPDHLQCLLEFSDGFQF